MIEYKINSDGKYEKLVLHVINQSNDPYSDLSDKVRTPLVLLSVLAPSPSPSNPLSCGPASAGVNDFTALLQGRETF